MKQSKNEGINMHHENDNEADLLMGVEPIAKYLGVTRRQAYRLVYDKIMPSFKLGGTVAARRSSLKKWMEGLEAEHAA
ncbi:MULTISPECIES: helix-turn-helix domain-containing protein [Brucella/Ochrobactrum group]|uniref:helix-turn-helix domain-containing protein n=1 Tax=Brucella/Ochrobactrum group TaxID=2826938 RepID=UPI0011AB9570|nr:MULTISPECIES: helix-turn-helix domain-containing protein [Brucella/Ochrobactrum group]TWH01014.1 excisionase family DNA binding protein [Ochrobactrum sp. J50]